MSDGAALADELRALLAAVRAALEAGDVDTATATMQVLDACIRRARGAGTRIEDQPLVQALLGEQRATDDVALRVRDGLRDQVTSASSFVRARAAYDKHDG